MILGEFQKLIDVSNSEKNGLTLAPVGIFRKFLGLNNLFFDPPHFWFNKISHQVAPHITESLILGQNFVF